MYILFLFHLVKSLASGRVNPINSISLVLTRVENNTLSTLKCQMADINKVTRHVCSSYFHDECCERSSHHNGQGGQPLTKGSSTLNAGSIPILYKSVVMTNRGMEAWASLKCYCWTNSIMGSSLP